MRRSGSSMRPRICCRISSANERQHGIMIEKIRRQRRCQAAVDSTEAVVETLWPDWHRGVTNASTAACPWGAHGQILAFVWQLLGMPILSENGDNGRNLMGWL
jgi:hypothetical protein